MTALAAGGCRTPAGAPPEQLLEPLPSRAPLVPDEADDAAAEVAAAALANRRAEAGLALLRLRSIDAVRREDGRPPTGLTPYARDLLHTTLDDAHLYRQASRTLLAEEGRRLPPRLRRRLEAETAEDPLEVARERVRAAWIQRWGGLFNALVAPASRAVTSPVAASVGVAEAILKIALARHQEEALTLFERQALAEWKRFLEEHPDAPEALSVVEKVERAQARWNTTRRDRAVRAARRALGEGDARVALLNADRALRFEPGDREAAALHEYATTRLEAERRARSRALEAAGDAASFADPRVATLVRELLLGEPVSEKAEAWLAAEPRGELADELRYVLATEAGEAGREGEMWRILEELAEADPEEANMALHARALVANPEQNPYWAFRVARAADRRARGGWLLLGPLFRGPRDRDLPRSLEYLVEVPTFLEALLSIPNRLLAYPWMNPWPFGRRPAAYAHRYLARHPRGEYAAEVRRWLVDHERRVGNHVAALRLLEDDPEPDPDTLREVREDAAEQILAAARRQRRIDARAGLLREAASRLGDTPAGREAGRELRELATETTPMHVRMSREFLRENPELAGPAGLALAPGLLDDDPRNGELHPRGITLLGGRRVEVAVLAPSGDPDDEPALRVIEISEERLARVAALLEETSLRNALVDPDYDHEIDADRDRFFERARLGLADRPDPRPAARSGYAFLGMREKYGLVRGRESILPVDLVVQGSLSTLSLGAFPRVRMPKPPPDAVLYR